MRRHASAILMVLGFIACLSQASAADRYWISSTAKNWSDSSAWSATSGGAGGASVPESGDKAFFDAGGAGNCTVSASISVDRVEIASGYTGLVVLGSNVTVMTGSVVLDGTLRMGTNSNLQLMDSDVPLSGSGILDTGTNSPNTVEYRGGDEVEIASSTPVSAYSNLTLTPPGGISRSAVFLGNANEQYFDMAAVDSAAGFLYVGSKNAPAKIVKIRLSDYARVGTLTLASGENDLSPSVVVDSANGFLYAGTRTSPAKVVKIRLSDFTEVGAISLNTGENQLWSATLDSANGYAYFGTRTSPARIIKIRLSDFTREAAITLASGENEALGAVIDEAAGFAYFGLQTTPAKVVKVRLSDFTAVATLTCNSGEDMVRVGVIDVAAGFAYFGLKTSPGKVVRVKLSDFTRDAVLTMNTGENKLYSGVIDPAGGFAYFGAYTNPGTVIKVKLDDFTRVDAVTFGAGEKELDTAAIDASSGYAYFMTDNWVGKAVKVNLNYVGAEWTHPSVLDVNGNLTIGAGTLTSAGQGIALAGNWSNAGTFNPGLSTVTLDGGNQAVNGNNTFRNLTKTVTSAATLTFESGKAQQIVGTLNFQGVSGNLLSLRASSTGQSWRLVAENYQATRFADIKDADASEGRSLIALSSTDSGNNQNVLFSSPAQVAITTPATSATSPAWVEGSNSGDVSAVTITVDSGTPFNAVRLSPTKWFADNASAGGASLGVTLSASTATHVEVSVSNPFGNVNSASQDITWTATDLNGLSYSSDTVRIRKGDSLLLTATGTGTALEIDGHGDGAFEHSGTPGQKFPTLYSATGTYIARAKIDGVEVGSLAVVVIGVDLHGPIACEVGFQREKDVDVSPASETANVSFVANDGFWVTTSVKQTIVTGATLYIKTLRRGAPSLESRLGGNSGALLAYQGVDEFTRNSPALLSALINEVSGVGGTTLVMRPYIANIRWQFDMFASTSTFEGGVSTLSVNTSDAPFSQVYDPMTGETIGIFELALEVPAEEDKYCFNCTAYQSSSPEKVVAGQENVNGGPCKARSETLVLCSGGTGKLRVQLTRRNAAHGKHDMVITGGPENAVRPKFTKPVPPSETCPACFDCAAVEGTIFEEEVTAAGATVGEYDLKIGLATFEKTIKITDNLDIFMRNFGKLSPIEEYEKREIVKTQGFQNIDDLGIMTFGKGDSKFPDTSGVGHAEFVGVTCDVQEGDTYEWKRKISSRFWTILVDQNQSTATPVPGEDDSNKVDDDPQSADVTPSVSKKVYTADNPSANLQGFNGDTRIKFVIRKFTAIERLIRIRNGQQTIRDLPWHFVVVVKRIGTGENTAANWETIKGKSEIEPGEIGMSLTNAEAKAILDDPNVTYVDNPDINEGPPEQPSF